MRAPFGLLLVAVVVGLSSLPVGAAQGQPPELQKFVAVYLGRQFPDEDTWGAVEEKVQYGIVSSWRGPKWPLYVAVDAFRSSFEAPILLAREITEYELDVGVRWIHHTHRVRPYVGGGVAMIKTFAEHLEFNFPSDTGTGVWFGAGVQWLITNHVAVALDGRFSRADLTIPDFGSFAGESGGKHLGFLLGYAW